jgi:glucose-6-phosphate 1-dehydrogenase
VTPSPDRHLFVIHGGTGDLARRKLLPSLYRIMTETDGSSGCVALLGVGSTPLDDGGYRQWARTALQESGIDDRDLAAWCDRTVFYQQVPRGTEDLGALAARIDEVETTLGLPGNRVFHLALPPVALPAIVTALGAQGLNTSPGWTRLIVEKPFGRDLASARELNLLLHRHYTEQQIYRIDHYLGKETVQNLLAFRFANPLFEWSWNRDRISAVEITVAEDLGIGTRAGYYDHTGAVRDMVQNHLTQLVTLVAMEAPTSFAADAIRTEKVQVLEAVRAIDLSDVVLGQYAGGVVSGAPAPGYLEEPNVPANSRTATFAGLRLWIDTWRWSGVPFYLRTGKRLPRKTTQIAITFHQPPVCLFHGVADECKAHRNVVLLILQPDEGFEVRFDVKAPGEALQLDSWPLRFGYGEAFESLPDAYQTLLLDVMEGDQTLFVRADEVEASWRLYAPILEAEMDAELPVHPYPAGTWGPEVTDEILGRCENEEWTMRG